MCGVTAAKCLDICAAVQHARQKGIIHRDIKPSNVLVASHDGTPVVKVIDFGIAKAITDPDANYGKLGWIDDQPTYPKYGGEIGDIIEGLYPDNFNGRNVRLRGYVVQKESDKLDQALVPAGATPL